MRRLAILICTCDRHTLLDQLLTALSRQVEGSRNTVTSVVIVDNGRRPSDAVVEAHRPSLPISYVRLLEPGLVVARNACLRLGMSSHPEYLIFIDDDEVPNSGWLDNLVEAIEASGADLANGPVFPALEVEPPAWAEEFFTKSGDTLCTSNLIMKASTVPAEEDDWFNPLFNFTGGEDNEFLGRLVRNGALHITAPAAAVTEFIPSGRLRYSYLLRVGIRDGAVTAQKALIGPGGVLCRYMRPLRIALQKLAYGSNHLLWSWRSADRYHRAVIDFGYGAGVLMRLAGVSPAIYGRKKRTP